MIYRYVAVLVSGGLCLSLGWAGAQGAPPPIPRLAVERPTYVTPSFAIMVERPAETVWARVGKFCDIAEWRLVTCSIISGSENRVGVVRSLIGGLSIEMMVARSKHSYTYAQAALAGVPFNAAHGTLEVVPLTSKTSKLVYSFFYDNSMLKDDAARAAEAADRQDRIMKALRNMKTLAEGGHELLTF